MSRRTTLAALLLVAAGVLLGSLCASLFLPGTPRGEAAADPDDKSKDNIDKNTVDFGIVASDAAKTVAFYKAALGFQEAEGFNVPAAMAKASGLTAGQPFRVRVLIASDKSKATKIKIIDFPKAPGAKIDNTYIHSSLGYRYITVYINDTTAALAGLKKLGLAPVKPPFPLPDGKNHLTLIRDPDGNMIELVGPKL